MGLRKYAKRKEKKTITVHLPHYIIKFYAKKTCNLKTNYPSISGVMRDQILKFIDSENKIEPMKITQIESERVDISVDVDVYEALNVRFKSYGGVKRSVQAIIVSGAVCSQDQ